MKKLYLTSFTCKSINKIDFSNKKKVAFIPTAADVYEDKWFVNNDREAFVKKGLEVVDIDLKIYNSSELYEKLKSFDIIFFSGGSAYYLLQVMKEKKFDKVLDKLLNKGAIYIGSSAGSVVVCPNISFIKSMDDPDKAPKLKDFRGLNLVNFYFLPHYGREKYAEVCNQILKENKDREIIPVKDDELIVVEGDNWKKI
jgi:dipeptidase E